MNKSIVRVFESVFNVAYLGTVWTLVALMIAGRKRVTKADSPLAGRFLAAFALLAFGDTFHVGARVIEAMLGGATFFLNGIETAAIGLGMLATAYTMTGFYMLLADARAARNDGRRDAAFWVMEVLLGARLVIMALPGNAWEAAVPPVFMGIVRNAPLALAGIVMAVLFIAEGRRSDDRAWSGIGWAMVASYACYVPVILFAAAFPILGLLMIPKTVAYVVMGIVVYKRYWGGAAARAFLKAGAAPLAAV